MLLASPAPRVFRGDRPSDCLAPTSAMLTSVGLAAGIEQDDAGSYRRPLPPPGSGYARVQVLTRLLMTPVLSVVVAVTAAFPGDDVRLKRADRSA